MERLDLRAGVGERAPRRLLVDAAAVVHGVDDAEPGLAGHEDVRDRGLQLQIDVRAIVVLHGEREAAEADDVDEVVLGIVSVEAQHRRTALAPVAHDDRAIEREGASELQERRDLAQLIARGLHEPVGVDDVAAERTRSDRAIGRLHDDAHLVVAKEVVADETLRRRPRHTLAVEVGRVEPSGGGQRRAALGRQRRQRRFERARVIATNAHEQEK
ncbi:MAG: hypothetical protein LC659_07425 [Myxococcales bacterium]|nr:hypothetical protein [Myxococcales bacterium]